jgi:hypothetical protein
MTEPVPTVNRSAIVISTLFFTLAAATMVAWIAGWFFTPRPSWSTGTGGIGFALIVLGSSVRKLGTRSSPTPPPTDA